MSEHVIKRGARYYYRRRVPTDLVQLYGKTEVQKALGTSDRRQAEKDARKVAVEFDTIFERLRSPEAAPLQTESHAPEPDKPIWITDAPLQPLSLKQLEHEAELAKLQLEEEMREERLAELEEAVRRVLGKPAAEHSARSPTAPATRHGTAVATPPETSGMEKSLDRLARLWEKARTPTSGVAYAMYRTVDRFKAMVGNVLVTRITKAQVVQFKDKMLVQGIGNAAITASLNHMRTLCGFAIGQAWIDVNPATGVKLEGKKRNAKTIRPPLDTATLGRIFNSRVYTDNYRPKSGLGEAIYWLPLLGLYTGARLEELAQLHPEDIYQDAYRDATGKEHLCWVLRLTDNEHHGQGVKNEHSRRRLPIHSEILNAGFIEYVERHKGQRRIFPGMKPDKHGVESAVWSKWWINQHLRKECAPTSPKMVYHSFRHTFKDVCRECGISKEVADALQGHSEGDAAGNYGAEFYPLRPLVEAIARYQVHGLDLPNVGGIPGRSQPP